MPIVVLMAVHENVAGAKGHCFKRASKGMEYGRIGESLEPPRCCRSSANVHESRRRLYRMAKQEMRKPVACERLR
jgi:hypothetical protein